MITRIELENFKGIRERVALDLKPITLLFGANSSGKSTIIHALHYALEVLRGNLDADRTRLGGDSLDLGGVRSFVHGHDVDRRITMLFELDADRTLVDYTDTVAQVSPVTWGAPGSDVDVQDRVLSAWVRLEVGWSWVHKRPMVYVYEVGVNGDRDHSVIRIEAASGRGQASSLVLRVDHALFRSAYETEDETELARLVADAGKSLQGGCAILEAYQESALPGWGRPIRLWNFDHSSPAPASFVAVARIVSLLGVGIGELLVSKLERLLYIGPLRAVPPRSYRPALTENPGRWADGLGAWDALHRRGGSLVRQADEWMRKLGTGYGIELRQVLEVGGAVADMESTLSSIVDHADAQYPLDPADEEYDDVSNQRVDVAATRGDIEVFRRGLKAIQGLRERHDLVLVDARSGATLRPHDVGVGISQVLPVIVAALYRGERGAGAFVAVEQPELHIHPRLQVALADLFIEQSNAGTVSDHQFLIETHSEHLLLRLLRRIREASEKGSGPGFFNKGSRPGSFNKGGRPGPADKGGGPSDEDEERPLAPSHVAVVYVQRGEDGGVQLVPLRIDERGEFLDVWPEGFFEERDPELFG